MVDGSGRNPDELLSAAIEAEQRGRVGEAYRTFERAYEVAAAAGDDLVAARALLGYGGMWANERRATDEYVPYQAHLHELKVRVADRDPLLSARLGARAAADACYAERGSIADMRVAIEQVRSFGEPYALWEALSLHHHLLIGPHDAAEREQTRKELVTVAANIGVPWCVATGLMWSAIDAVLRGDPDAVNDIEQFRRYSTEHDVANFVYQAGMLDVMLTLRAGRFDEAATAMEQMLVLGTSVGENDALALYSGQLLTLRWLQGRAGELLDLARELSNSPTMHRSNRVYPAVAAGLAAMAGDYDDARVGLARVGAFDGEPFGLIPSSTWLLTMYAVVEAIYSLGDVEHAVQAYRALEPFSDLPIIGSIGVVCFGSVHRSLALCAHTVGDVHAAVKHFERAIDDDLRFGNLAVLAVTRAELARELGARNEADDVARARELYAHAIAEGTEFGMSERVPLWQTELERLAQQVVHDADGRCVATRDGWEITRGREHASVPAGVGINVLATLLANPGVEISADRLVGAAEDHANDPLLDPAARRALQRRVQDLRADAAAAEAAGDGRRAERTREELERLADELSRSLRPDGTSRTFAGSQERARTSVQKAIRRALRAVEDSAPGVAAELRRDVRTGSYCVYEPRPGAASWSVERAVPSPG
ncbi:MAG TPA: hypothetical protein VGO03_17130 [Acidimicrobiia bacterium]|jgi:tetratricopeptide (TPR) repeat protein